jgi:short-subunit dehydrogenase
MMFDDLKDKRALVTGASRGIGAQIARGLAERGVKLVLTARDLAKLESVARECAALGVEVRTLAADVSRAEDRERMLAEAGELEILINNAGVEHTRSLTDQSEADVRGQIETNLFAPIDLTRRALPAMLARRSGVIVNISSMSGKGATPFNAVYAATKHGLNGFSSSLGVELHGSGVHVGVVCPGFVSEAGMWANTGLSAPRTMREVSPERVVRAVLRVIRGESEVLVTPGPMRPLLALRELMPGVEGRMLRAMGIVRVLAARADASK